MNGCEEQMDRWMCRTELREGQIDYSTVIECLGSVLDGQR